MVQLYEGQGNSTKVEFSNDTGASQKIIAIPAGAYYVGVAAREAIEVFIDPDGTGTLDQTDGGNTWPLVADEKLPLVEVHRFAGLGGRIIVETLAGGNFAGGFSVMFTGKDLDV